MKIVVFGGTGLIGSKLVRRLTEQGHIAVAASAETGVDAMTDRGLRRALRHARVVVDVMNSPPFEENSAPELFQMATRNLLAAEEAAGVCHHVALCTVGTDRLLESPYFCAKMAQEALIEEWGIPYTILRSTQLFEFIGRVGNASPDGKSVRATSAFVQPIASDDVVSGLAKIAVGRPANGVLEIGGPERFRLDDLLRGLMEATGDPRQVITDRRARYFGTFLDEQTLTPDVPRILGKTRFAEWVARYLGQAPIAAPHSRARQGTARDAVPYARSRRARRFTGQSRAALLLAVAAESCRQSRPNGDQAYQELLHGLCDANFDNHSRRRGTSS